MGIKKNKPTSPGRRFNTCSTFEELTRKGPEKSLTGHEEICRKKFHGQNNVQT